MFRFDQASARVEGLKDHAIRLSGEAKDESKMADGMLKTIANMERNIPTSLNVMAAVRCRKLILEKILHENVLCLTPPHFPHDAQEGSDAMVSKLDDLKGQVDENISGFEALQDGVQRDKAATQNLLANGKSAQQVVT